MKFNLKFLFITLFICAVSMAQTKGTISGVLTDKQTNNEALPFANVLIKGTNNSANTDIDGKYSISIAPGSYTVIYSFLGYETVEVPVIVKSNETTTVNQALSSGSYTLKDVVVKASSVSKQKESALLLEQKNAVEIKQSIGAQELSRKGVSDVATAVTKTTGITKQEGTGNIFVRGLGDRYNSTTMNGLPIPSNDPEKKNINLDIFSTDIVEYVSVDKVYSSKLYGDFAGGNVDIASKDYKGNGYFKIEIGSNVNTNAITQDDFKLQRGINSFGFSNPSIPNNPLTQYNYNTLQMDGKAPFAGSIGLSGGKSFNVGEQGKLSFFATANFGNEYNAVKNGTAKGSVNGAGVAYKDFNSYTDMSYQTNSTGLLNIGYKVNSNNKINFNTLYINTSTQSKEEYYGYIVDIANNGNGLIRRFNYEKNSLWVNQLLGDHKLTDRSKLNWGVSYNLVDGSMPDRVQNTFRNEPTGYVLSTISRPENNRYFQKLKENELAANASIDYKFNKTSDDEFKGKFTLGASGRIKNRNFEATQFNFQSNDGYRNFIVDPNNLDLFYNNDNLNNGYFNISTFRGNSQVANSLDPQTYDGKQTIYGGFINTEYKFNPKLTAVLGLRLESVVQDVNWDTQLGDVGSDKLEKLAFLPSLTMKYELNEKQNLRLGFSKTYTLPQFKERALFVYEEVLQVKVGNPYLYESDDYNLDLKWEMFPKSDELISFTAFGKYILNPMNEVTIASSSNDISYINTGDYGYVAGGEVEYRKQIFSFNDSKKLTAGINASYLYSNQELNSEKVNNETDYQVDFTNKKSQFTGASDLLLNADLSYLTEWSNKEKSLNTTIAYSYFSDRINAIGTNGRGDLVDKAFGSLDFIAKTKLNKNLGLDFVVKNILDPTINRVQENSSGDVNVLSYKKGLGLSFKLNYTF